MFRINVKREFDAAHFLCNTETKCDQIHGHRWTVVATFTSTQLTKSGWVINFTTAKKWIDAVLEEFDHNILNFYLPQPTAENLCLCLWRALAGHVTTYRETGSDLKLEKVEIYETPNNSASF